MPKRLEIRFTLDPIEVELLRAVMDHDGVSLSDPSQVVKQTCLHSLADAVSFDHRVPASRRVLQLALGISDQH